MSSGTKTTMLVLAIVCLSLATISVGVTAFYTSLSFYEIYKTTSNVGSVVLGILYWFPVVCYGMMSIFFAGGVLPFDLILLNKGKVKKWYTIIILVLAIAIIVAAFTMIFALPIATSVANASRHSSSSTSSL